MPQQRQPDNLLARIRAYVDDRGITGLTMEELASALAMEPADLLAQFKTKEELVVALVAAARQRQLEAYAAIDSDTSLSALERSRSRWGILVDSPGTARLVFEALGLAMRDARYSEAVRDTGDPIPFWEETLQRDGFAKEKTAALGTLSVAIHRGAMMDYCATGERDRVNAAMDLWFKLIREDMPPDDA